MTVFPSVTAELRRRLAAPARAASGLRRGEDEPATHVSRAPVASNTVARPAASASGRHRQLNIDVFPARLVNDWSWADPPIASEGVIRSSARSRRGTNFLPGLRSRVLLH